MFDVDKLTFSISAGRLKGEIAGTHFDVPADSGGGGGSKLGLADPLVVNNPTMTSRAANRGEGIRGGPLPIGRYKICAPEAHEHLGRCARLDPSDATLLRRTFYVHGPGPLGSDGCIVPTRRFTELMRALEESRGGTLEVVW
jgi:hypothetical protein